MGGCVEHLSCSTFPLFAVLKIDKMSGGNGEGPAKKRQSGGAAIARLAGETSDNMKKQNDGKGMPDWLFSSRGFRFRYISL